MLFYLEVEDDKSRCTQDPDMVLALGSLLAVLVEYMGPKDPASVCNIQDKQCTYFPISLTL